ncbi:MAG: hypothetical protein MMC33_007757 [Icmadophila ericetorum]|nr:hypothetical protein [Icmadophila ericetorum]
MPVENSQAPLSLSEKSGELDNGTSKQFPRQSSSNWCQFPKRPCPAHLRALPTNVVVDDKECQLSISSRSDSARSIPVLTYLCRDNHDHQDSTPRQSQDLHSAVRDAPWQHYNSSQHPHQDAGSDMEKHTAVQACSLHQPLSVQMTLEPEDLSNEESSLEEHVSSLLIYLLLLAPFLSLLTSLYTLLALLFLLLTFPLALCCNPHPRISSWISASLLPPLNIHLSLLHTAIRSRQTINTPLLILINLLLPLYSLLITCAAWTAAIFWAYAAVLGNPASSSGGGGGGGGRGELGNTNAAAIFRVARWWIWWLGMPFDDLDGDGGSDVEQ